MRFFEKGTIRVSLVAERSEVRETNGKQTSELNSVGPKTQKPIEISGPTILPLTQRKLLDGLQIFDMFFCMF